MAAHVKLAKDIPFATVLSADGSVRLANAASGTSLRFTTRSSNVTGGIADNQSGTGWSWNKDTLTLTISKDISVSAANHPVSSRDAALVLPSGSRIVIAPGVTATFDGADSGDGVGGWGVDLTITGGGTLRALVGSDGRCALEVGDLTVEGVTLELGGTADEKGITNGNYGLSASGTISLESCDVRIDGTSFAILGRDDINVSGGSLSIPDASYGVVAVKGNVSMDAVGLALDSLIGIHTEGSGSESITLSDCTGYVGGAYEGGIAFESNCYAADAQTDGKITINNLDPARYAVGNYVETVGETTYYAVTVFGAGDDASPATQVWLGLGSGEEGEVPGGTTDTSKPETDGTAGEGDSSGTDGQTDADTLPATGDDGNTALWSAAMVAAGAALIGTGLYGRKRAYSR